MSKDDTIKIRVASRLFLLGRKEATTRAITQYILDSNIPFRKIPNTNSVARVLKSSTSSWGFEKRRNSNNAYVWSVKK